MPGQPQSTSSGDPVEDIAAEIHAMSRSDVAAVSRACLDHSAAELITWQAKPLAASSIGNGTLGFLKVSGEAATGSETVQWSAVVKAMEPAPARTLGGFNNPQREIDAYRSGFLAQIDSGIVPAPCYKVTARPDNTVWLWLMDLSESIQPPYELPLFLKIQRDTGRFNGDWPASRVPDFAWLPRDGSNLQIPSTRQQLHAHRREHGELKDSPLMSSAANGIGFDRLMSVDDSLAELERVIAHLPQSLAHNDWHARNLMPVAGETGEPITYGIDWASIGLAPVGVDGGGLFGSSLTRGSDEALMMLTHEAEFFEAYIHGLTEAGWKGLRNEVRIAYLAEVINYLVILERVVRILAVGGDFVGFLRDRFGAEDQAIAEEIGERLVAAYPLIEEATEIAGRL